MATVTLAQIKSLVYRYLGRHWQSTATTQTVQTVAISGTPTGGHYHLIWNAVTSGEIAYNAAAADVQTALRAMSGLENVTVRATGGTPNFTHTILFAGVVVGGSALTSDATALTGGTPVITITGGATTRLTDLALVDLGEEDWPFPVVGQQIKTSADLRRVARVDKANGDLYFARPLSAVPVYGTAYEVWGNVIEGGTGLTNAVNDVLRRMRYLDQTQVTIVTDQRHYDITTTVAHAQDVIEVYRRDLDSASLEPYNAEPVDWFRARDKTGSGIRQVDLEIYPALTLDATTREMWVEYYKTFTEFSTTVDTGTVDATYKDWIAKEVALAIASERADDKPDRPYWQSIVKRLAGDCRAMRGRYCPYRTRRQLPERPMGY